MSYHWLVLPLRLLIGQIVESDRHVQVSHTLFETTSSSTYHGRSILLTSASFFILQNSRLIFLTGERFNKQSPSWKLAAGGLNSTGRFVSRHCVFSNSGLGCLCTTNALPSSPQSPRWTSRPRAPRWGVLGKHLSLRQGFITQRTLQQRQNELGSLFLEEKDVEEK